MGCNNSREKDLKEKSSLNSKELEKLRAKFQKLSRIAPGKEGQFISMEGFRTAFPENEGLADKLYKFVKSQGQQFDFEALLLTMELLTKPKSEIYIQSFNYKQLEQYQLLLLISITNPDILKKEEFKSASLAKLEITYLQAGIYIKEIINMMSPKTGKLSNDDDVAAKLLINNIFGEKTSNMDFQQFCNAIKFEVPLLNTVIRRNFAGKFTDSAGKIHLPEMSNDSKIINHQILGLFYLSTPWFYQTQKLNLVYEYTEGQDQYDFNQLTNALMSAPGPTVILFRHVERMGRHEKLPYQHTMDENLEAFEQYYHFGFYCPTFWRLSPDITGDKNCSLFSIVPKYQQYITARGKGQSKFALLNSEQGRPLQGQLAQKLRKFGLGLGGSGLEQHRVWLDGTNLKDSYVNEEDKTFMSGHLLAPHIKQLCLDRIEVWTLEFIAPIQDMSHFRQTQLNHITRLLQEDTTTHNQQHPTDVLQSIRKNGQSEQVDSQIQKFEEEEKIYSN